MPNIFPYNLEFIPSDAHYQMNVAIFHALEKAVLTEKYHVGCLWSYLSEIGSQQAILNYSSNKYRDIKFSFNILFPANFPISPPKILPMNYLPARAFVCISNHPMTTRKYWSPNQDLHEIFDSIITHLETYSLETLSSMKTPVFPDHLLIGQAAQRTKTALNLHISNELLYDLKDVCAESWIAELTGHFLYELKGYEDFQNLIESFISSELCLVLTNESSQGYVPGKGTGYGGRSNYHQPYQQYSKQKPPAPPDKKSTVANLMKLIFETMPTYSNYKSQKKADEEIDILSFSDWFLISPLLDIVSQLFEYSSKEEIYKNYEFIGMLSSIVYRLEKIREYSWGCFSDYRRTDRRKLSFSEKRRDAAIVIMFKSFYQKLHQSVTLNLFQDYSGKSMKWLDEIENNSSLYKEAKALPREDSIQISSTSMKKPQVTRVHHIDKLESFNYFYKNANNSLGKISKNWMKEMICIEENLPDEISLFISEEQPNYCIAVMNITNIDCPYYGGSFVFHMKIDNDHPKKSPTVHFMTTGNGQVRFNPNLYNCGKVCLSLLGTWSGEPWDPKKSNITQVLNSILFLIFTEEPYCNEPAFEGYRGKKSKESISYDAQVIQFTLLHAILHYFQLKSPNCIDNHIKQYYQNHWHLHIRNNLITKLRNFCNENRSFSYMKFEAIIKKIDAFIPFPEESINLTLDKDEDVGKSPFSPTRLKRSKDEVITLLEETEIPYSKLSKVIHIDSHEPPPPSCSSSAFPSHQNTMHTKSKEREIIEIL